MYYLPFAQTFLLLLFFIIAVIKHFLEIVWSYDGNMRYNINLVRLNQNLNIIEL